MVKDMVKNLPENVQPVLEGTHLNRLLGLKSADSGKPKLGRTWNKVVLFPSSGAFQ